MYVSVSSCKARTSILLIICLFAVSPVRSFKIEVIARKGSTRVDDLTVRRHLRHFHTEFSTWEEPSLHNKAVVQNTTCPASCTLPIGACLTSFLSTYCICNEHHLDSFCEGTLYNVSKEGSVSGTLLPGKWVYIDLYVGPPSLSGSHYLQFNHTGGKSLFLIKDGGLPTSNDTDYNITILSSSQVVQSMLTVTYNTTKNGHIVFGIFNLENEGPAFTYSILFTYTKNKSNSNLSAIVIAAFTSIVVIIIVALCIGVVVYQILLVVNRNRRTSASEIQLPTAAPKGLDQKIVESFPIINYDVPRIPSASEEEAVCSVCLGVYVSGDALRQLHPCNHLFHVTCIDEWLNTHTTCPLCRNSLADQGT